MSKFTLGIAFIFCAASVHAQGSRPPAFTIVNAANAGPAAPATAASVSLPIVTFLIDDTHQIRPAVGVPGSAAIGAPLNLGFQVIDASIFTSHDYILAITRDTDWPMLLQVRGNTITIRSKVFGNPSVTGGQECDVPADMPLYSRTRPPRCRPQPTAANPSPRIDRIALSPGGSAAAFFSESERRVYAFANLSQSPVPLGSFTIDSAGALTAFGITDDGSAVAFGLSDGNTGALYLRRLNERTGTNRFVASMREVSVIHFLHGSDTAIVADRLDNTVYNVSNGQLFTAAAAEHGIAQPVGIGISNDNQKIFVANAASGSVTTIGPSGMVAEPVSCGCSLTGLHSTNTDSVFRLTDLAGGPVLIFDGSAALPRITVLPVSSVF